MSTTKVSQRKNDKRYRVSVPEDDESVIEWIESQHNISMSVRQLIHESIVKNGYSDIFCKPIGSLGGMQK